MVKFERVKRFEEDETINLPIRGTSHAAGYDFEVAEDTIVPSYQDMMKYINEVLESNDIDMAEKRNETYPLNAVKDFMSKMQIKPTLVPTGIKCALDADKYLELSVRSSTPLKYWLILANGVGKH